MVCTGNKDRSPTAAMLIAEMCAPMWVTSAGTEPWSKNPVNQELIEEADVICVMEDAHRRVILERFGDAHADKVVVLDIPDNYICWEAVAGAATQAEAAGRARDRQPAHSSRPSTF